MKTMIVALLAGCCLAHPLMQVPVTIAGQPWTAYTLTQESPAVIRIASPGLKFNLPQHPTKPLFKPLVIVPATPTAEMAPLLKEAGPVITADIPVAGVAKPIVKESLSTISLAAASPSHSPVVVAAAPEPLQAANPPMPSVGTPFVGGQFHAQDEAGQYTFGHWGGSNTRVESKDLLDRVTGSFSYVDPNGDVQVRKYAAAPVMGFKVAASDLPVDHNVPVEDTPNVAEAKAAHARAFSAVLKALTPTTTSV